MKNMMVLFVLIFLSMNTSAEFMENPDKYTSVGVNYLGLSMTGIAYYLNNGVTENQDFWRGDNQVVLDCRVPVSDYITLNAGAGYINHVTYLDETNLLAGGKARGEGIVYSVGARYYFH